MHDILKFQNSQCSISKIHHISYIFLTWVWIWILTKLPFLDISCFFVIWVWIRIVSKLSFPDTSCIFLIWIWIVTKLHFQRKCSFGSYASYHSTWHYSELGLVGKILVICNIFLDARTGYWQLHNCQLGPFDGLALGMGWLESTSQAHINQSMDRRWIGNIFRLGLSSLANHSG
jgi:hypothetical protein